MSALDFLKSDRSQTTLRTWEPLTREFDQVFREMSRLLGPMRTHSNGIDLAPPCDISDSETEYYVTIDIPGLEKDDFDVEISGNSLKISGEKKQVRQERKLHHYKTERAYGRFEKSFVLPEGLKKEEIEANYNNGVLSLTLPKIEKSKFKRISVKGGKPGFVAKIASKGKQKAANE